MQNKIKGSISIDPVGYENIWPEVSVMLDHDLLFSGLMETPQLIKFDKIVNSGNHRLSVQFHNKKDSDTDINTGQDNAVKIKSIEFFGITSPNFVWAGRYQPIYPSHIKDEPKILTYHDYLGWNGDWYLDFNTPIFSWIHYIENLGWIYD